MKNTSGTWYMQNVHLTVIRDRDIHTLVPAVWSSSFHEAHSGGSFCSYIVDASRVSAFGQHIRVKFWVYISYFNLLDPSFDDAWSIIFRWVSLNLWKTKYRESIYCMRFPYFKNIVFGQILSCPNYTLWKPGIPALLVLNFKRNRKEKNYIFLWSGHLLY